MSARDDSDVTVRQNTENRTYEAVVGEELVGIVVYERTGPARLALTHAAVEEHHRNRGIGMRLVTDVLDDIRRQGQTITVYCQVVVDYLGKHPEYADLVDPEAPGRVTRTAAGRPSE